jgi:hypothetical protein
VTRLIANALAAFVVLSVAATVVRADDPCGEFTWEVARERALFGAEPRILPAGQDVSSAPELTLDRLYQLSLSPQANVTFAVTPAKKARTDGSLAGLGRLTVDTSGNYRVSLDRPVWVDVVLNGTLIRSRDFQGRPGCQAPHKIVEFVLPAGVALQLQISGAADPVVRVAVTRSPAPVP